MPLAQKEPDSSVPCRQCDAYDVGADVVGAPEWFSHAKDVRVSKNWCPPRTTIGVCITDKRALDSLTDKHVRGLVSVRTSSFSIAYAKPADTPEKTVNPFWVERVVIMLAKPVIARMRLYPLECGVIRIRFDADTYATQNYRVDASHDLRFM